MIDRFISTFTLFLGPIFLALQFTLINGLSQGLFCAYGLSERGIKIIPHLRRRPNDILLVLFLFYKFSDGNYKTHSLVTIREQKWIREYNHTKKEPEMFSCG